MTKSLIVLCLPIMLLISIGNVNGQSFDKGTNVLTGGVGLGGRFGSYSFSKQSPALSLAYERGVWNDVGPGVIGLGAYFGFKSFTHTGNDVYGSYKQKWNYSIMGLRGAYHYDFTEKKVLDTYAGLFLGIYSVNYRADYPIAYPAYLVPRYSGSRFASALYIGSRYYITENAGVFAELGYGISYLTIGGQIKF